MEDYKKETIKSYDKHAKEFSEKFKELMDLKRRYEFQRFIGLLKGKKILDLGCGSGDHAVYFSKQGFDVTCIDLSKEMIELCKEKGLNASIMDIEDLKFEDNFFDGIWATTSLLHILKSKIPNIVKKLTLLLKNNGILYICLKEGEGEKIKEEGKGLKRFFAFWKKEELLKIFKRSFELIEFKKVKLGHTVFLQFFFRKK